MGAPLDLKNYFFPYVNVAADPTFQPEKQQHPMEWETRVAVTHDEEKDLYQVTVDIASIPESDEDQQPYSIRLIAVGLFQIHPEWQDPEKLLEVNGASILYSAAREYLITITSRGPWPAVTLPTISFLRKYQEEKEEQVAEKSSSLATD